MRDKKSSMDSKSPLFSRSKTILSAVISPTFLTAEKPKRISLSLTVNSEELKLVNKVFNQAKVN